MENQYGAIRLSYNVTFTYEGTGKNEVATSMTWECREDKAAQRRKFHGKYVLLTSLDESQELNIWKFYNVIRTVEETFHVLKTDLDAHCQHTGCGYSLYSINLPIPISMPVLFLF